MFKQDYNYTGQRADRSFCGEGFRHKFEKFQERFFEGKALFKRESSSGRADQVSVNIVEEDLFFELRLYAAGRTKQYFKLAIMNDILKITYQEPPVEHAEKYIYQEFAPTAFERSFQLRDQMLRDNIQASFEEGILTVILPKDPSKIRPHQEVPVG